MNTQNPSRWALVLTALAMLALSSLLAACASLGAAPQATEPAMEMDHDEGQAGDHDHQAEAHDQPVRIPNDGASIRIVEPPGGTRVSADEDVLVEVEVEGFTLGEDGKHWHIYVDGTSWGMVMGEDTTQALSGLEPGEHEVSVFLSVGSHEELEQGDSITISVGE